jgi:integration host factor subunit beta
MTKSELIQRLAKRYPYLYQRDIERLVNTVLESVSTALVEGGRVELRGFGAFSIRKREARKARNPKNGAEVYIGERYTIYFRTGKELRERINKKSGAVPSQSASTGA